MFDIDRAVSFHNGTIQLPFFEEMIVPEGWQWINTEEETIRRKSYRRRTLTGSQDMKITVSPVEGQDENDLGFDWSID